MKRQSLYIWTLLALFKMLPLIASSQFSLPGEPLPSSFYSRYLFQKDSWSAYFGKKSLSGNEVVQMSGIEGTASVYEATLSPQEIATHLRNPENLVFRNGKAYLKIENNLSYLTTIEFANTRPYNREHLRSALKTFREQLESEQLTPDLIQVKQNKTGFEITAFRCYTSGTRVAINYINVQAFQLHQKNAKDLASNTIKKSEQ